MSNILVQCNNCNQEIKEKDVIHDSKEGYICYKCIKERNEKTTNYKKSLDKWI